MIYPRNDSQLYDAKSNAGEIWKSPQKRAVQLKCQWIFQVGKAAFRLILRRAESDQDKAASTADRLAFVNHIPDEFKTFQGNLEGLEVLGVQSNVSTIT